MLCLCFRVLSVFGWVKFVINWAQDSDMLPNKICLFPPSYRAWPIPTWLRSRLDTSTLKPDVSLNLQLAYECGDLIYTYIYIYTSQKWAWNLKMDAFWKSSCSGSILNSWVGKYVVFVTPVLQTSTPASWILFTPRKPDVSSDKNLEGLILLRCFFLVTMY